VVRNNNSRRGHASVCRHEDCLPVRRGGGIRPCRRARVQRCALLGPLDASGQPTWRTRIGTFTGNGSEIKVQAGESINGVVHAEAHRLAIIGTDFEYSADVTVRDNAEAHLQFRISDDGRYGVLLGTQRLVIYRFQRVPYLALTPPRDCAPMQPGAITHCPEWSVRRHLLSFASSSREVQHS
jgi:hypothetical protein